MEVESYFAPPDPSAEVGSSALRDDDSGDVALATPSPAPDDPSAKTRTAMVVVVALVAATGLFFVGRWTTGGEREALVGDRDAALEERGQLQNSLDELQHALERANATNAAKQSTIDELKSAAAREATKLTDLQTEVADLATQSQKLQDSNEELWTHLDAVSECGNSIEFADAAFDKWAALFEALDDYLQSEVGSEQERQASERVDQAWA